MGKKGDKLKKTFTADKRIELFNWVVRLFDSNMAETASEDYLKEVQYFIDNEESLFAQPKKYLKYKNMLFGKNYNTAWTWKVFQDKPICNGTPKTFKLPETSTRVLNAEEQMVVQKTPSPIEEAPLPSVITIPTPTISSTTTTPTLTTLPSPIVSEEIKTPPSPNTRLLSFLVEFEDYKRINKAEIGELRTRVSNLENRVLDLQSIQSKALVMYAGAEVMATYWKACVRAFNLLQSGEFDNNPDPQDVQNIIDANRERVNVLEVNTLHKHMASDNRTNQAHTKLSTILSITDEEYRGVFLNTLSAQEADFLSRKAENITFSDTTKYSQILGYISAFKRDYGGFGNKEAVKEQMARTFSANYRRN